MRARLVSASLKLASGSRTGGGAEPGGMLPFAPGFASRHTATAIEENGSGALGPSRSWGSGPRQVAGLSCYLGQLERWSVDERDNYMGRLDRDEG